MSNRTLTAESRRHGDARRPPGPRPAARGVLVSAVLASLLLAVPPAAAQTIDDYRKCARRLASAVTDVSHEYLSAITRCDLRRIEKGAPASCEGDSQVASGVAGALQELRSKVGKCKREAEKALCPFQARTGDAIYKVLSGDAPLLGPIDDVAARLFLDETAGCPRPDRAVSSAARDCSKRVAQAAEQVIVDVERCLLDCEVGRIERGGDACVDAASGQPTRAKVVQCYVKALDDAENLLATKCGPVSLRELGCPAGATTVPALAAWLTSTAVTIAEPLNLGLFHSSCRKAPAPSAPPPVPVARVTLKPSGRQVEVACGQLIDKAFLRGDKQLVLEDDLSCAAVAAPTDGLVIGVKQLVIDGKGEHRITGPATSRYRTGAGIRLLPGAKKVRIRRIRQIQQFGYGIVDAGKNHELQVQEVTLFRNTIAGISTSSNKVRIQRVTADRNAIGFELQGDESEVKESIARGSTPAPGIGVLLRGSDTDRNDRSVSVRESQIEGNMVGIRIEGDAGRASQNTVHDSLGTGIEVVGAVARIDQNSVKRSGGDGIVLDGTGGAARKNRVDEGAASGIVVRGERNVVHNNTVGGPGGRGNAGAGIVAAGVDTVVTSNKAEASGGDGIVAATPTARLKGNRARANAGRGFAIDAAGNVVDSNVAAANAGAEFVVAPGNVDRPESNRANGTTFRFGAGGGTFE